MKILQNFVVFEGGDGSGTSTQMEKLNDLSLPFLHTTFEPTNGPIGRLIRSGLRGELSLQKESLAYLFAADRNEHVFGPGGIEERASRGELVICDRYVLSSLVYQGITCGEELPLTLNSIFPRPELLLFFDIDSNIAQKRIEMRREKEIYESLEFQLLVRERYRALLPRLEGEGCRIEIINASRTPEEVARDVWGALQKMPIFKA